MTASVQRPWYRLHLSTWVVIAVTLLLLALIVVPGGCPYEGPILIGVAGPPPYAHGWPFVWLVRYLPRSSFVSGHDAEFPGLCWARFGDAFWMRRVLWPFSGQCFLHWKGLVLDLLVALAVTAAIAFPWEWWRRRRFQYQLRSLLVFVLLVSVILAWWRTAAVQCAREQHAIDVMHHNYFWTETSSAAPDWLCRLVGCDRLPYFVIGIRIGMSDRQGAQDPESVGFAAARDFRYLHCAEMEVADDRTMMRLAALSADLERLHGSPGLRKVDVSGTDVTDAGLEHLKGLVRLKELDLSRSKVTAEGVKRLRQRLPNCEIMWEPRSDDK